MNRDTKPAARDWTFCVTGGILVALVFLGFWVASNPPRPHLPTSDLYTHLSVARHLARGEGFRTDVTYPLSFAFPFARELPQPLLHRQPGFAVLLTAPYRAGGGYPGRTVEMVRIMQIILLGIMVGVGAALLLRRGHGAAIGPWMILLFFSPLLVFAVDWGLVELVCSVVLLVIWLRAREKSLDRPDYRDGLLAGALAMLRLDLFWVPLFWWFLLRTRPWVKPRFDRRAGLVLAAWLVVVTPWVVRNLQMTGRPFFSLQSSAELVKDTRPWPGYSVYRQLEPQTLVATMTTDPVPVLRKFGRGVKFYFRELPRLIPRPGIWALGGFLVHFAVRRRRNGSRWENGPPALAAGTTLLLMFQYSFFDHSLRHLLVVVPVVFWELSLWLGKALPDFLTRTDRRLHLPTTPVAGIALAALAALAIVFVFPCRVPGWDSAAEEAIVRSPGTARQIDLALQTGPGVLFVDSSAVPWFIDRPVVWSPATPAIRAEICALLGMPDADPVEEP